jgi:hypothetical protein
MIFSKFGNSFLKWKVFTKDNVKYDFENKKFIILFYAHAMGQML